MAERLFDPNAVYFDTDGVTPCAGGTLTFSETGTSTPKSVYGEKELSTDNGNIIDIGVDGRAEVEIWGEGAYRVILKNENGDVVWTRDNVILAADAAELLALPDPSGEDDGAFLRVNGGVAEWDGGVPTLPDPTGNDGKRLVVSSDVYILETPPADPTIPTDGVAQSSGYLRIGTVGIKFGSDTAPSAAAQTTSKAITFAAAFAATPLVFITPQVGTVTGEGGGVECHATSVSTTGFTASMFAPDMGDVVGSENITGSVPFAWVAIGTVTP